MEKLKHQIKKYRIKDSKKFAMYLGIIKNIGFKRAYQIFSEIKQAKNIETPGKLFLYKSKYKKPDKKSKKKDNKK